MIRALLSKKRPFKLTPAGWVFILYTIGVGAGAINTGNNLLYLIFGLFLGLIMSSGFLSDLSLWGLNAHVTFPEITEAGKNNFIPIRVTNNKRLFPSLSVGVMIEGELAGETISLKIYLPEIPSLETVQTHFIFIPKSRGWFQLKSLKFTTLFPFGLLNKWWTHVKIERNESSIPFDPENGFLVTPARFFISARDAAIPQEHREQIISVDQKGHGPSVQGIREFRPSDNPKKIHWKASAKRFFQETNPVASWLVKEMDSEKNPTVGLEWPPLKEIQVWTSAELENFIRFTASVVDFYVNQGYEVKLLWEGLQIRQSALIRFLSLFDPQKNTFAAAEKFDDKLILSFLVHPAYLKWKKENTHVLS